MLCIGSALVERLSKCWIDDVTSAVTAHTATMPVVCDSDTLSYTREYVSTEEDSVE